MKTKTEVKMLDRSRHFCQIFGLPEPDGAIYVQDGVRFLGNGEAIGPETEAIEEQVVEPVVEESPSGDAPEAAPKTKAKAKTVVSTETPATDDDIV